MVKPNLWLDRKPSPRTSTASQQASYGSGSPGGLSMSRPFYGHPARTGRPDGAEHVMDSSFPRGDA